MAAERVGRGTPAFAALPLPPRPAAATATAAATAATVGHARRWPHLPQSPCACGVPPERGLASPQAGSPPAPFPLSPATAAATAGAAGGFPPPAFLPGHPEPKAGAPPTPSPAAHPGGGVVFTRPPAPPGRPPPSPTFAATPAVDAHWMGVALAAAAAAGERGEVPIGAVVVSSAGTPLAVAGNAVEATADATAHAEVVALRAAGAAAGGWRLGGATLYATVEPCALCALAAAAARVGRVVYGDPDHRLGGYGSWVDVGAMSHPYWQVGEVVGGVRAGGGALGGGGLVRAFFRRRRAETKAAARERAAGGGAPTVGLPEGVRLSRPCGGGGAAGGTAGECGAVVDEGSDGRASGQTPPAASTGRSSL